MGCKHIHWGGHLIGDHFSSLTKEQTTETMDPSPKTKELRPYPRHLKSLCKLCYLILIFYLRILL